MTYKAIQEGILSINNDVDPTLCTSALDWTYFVDDVGDCVSVSVLDVLALK